MGVPSCCLCSSHDSGVSTPSAFSQSKNTLGRSLNQLEISFPRPNVKTILFPIPSLPPIYTQIRTSPMRERSVCVSDKSNSGKIRLDRDNKPRLPLQNDVWQLWVQALQLRSGLTKRATGVSTKFICLKTSPVIIFWHE